MRRYRLGFRAKRASKRAEGNKADMKSGERYSKGGWAKAGKDPAQVLKTYKALRKGKSRRVSVLPGPLQVTFAVMLQASSDPDPLTDRCALEYV